MKKISRRSFLAVCSAMAATAALTACGGSSASTAGTAASGASAGWRTLAGAAAFPLLSSADANESASLDHLYHRHTFVIDRNL